MAVQGEPQPWGFDDLELDLGVPRATPGEIADAVKHDLGYDVPQRYRPPDGPDVGELAEGLGLR